MYKAADIGAIDGPTLKHPETELQKAVINFIRLALPGCVCFHVPNGGARSKREAAILKAMGILPGIPDVWVIYGGQVLTIELKAGKGKTTEAQRQILADLEHHGCNVGVARSLNEVEALLRTVWGDAIRGTLTSSVSYLSVFPR